MSPAGAGVDVAEGPGAVGGPMAAGASAVELPALLGGSFDFSILSAISGGRLQAAAGRGVGAEVRGRWHQRTATMHGSDLLALCGHTGGHFIHDDGLSPNTQD